MPHKKRMRGYRGSRVRTIGVGLMGQPAAEADTTPADLDDVALWLEAAAGTVRNAADGTGGAMSDTETVGRWIRPGDSLTSPAFPYATQATAGDKPALEIVSGKYWVNGEDSDLLEFSSSVSLAGDFVLWVVHKGLGGDTARIAGNASNIGQILVNDETVPSVFNDAGSSVQWGQQAESNGLLRIRRVSNVVYIAGTLVAEESAGSLSGTITLTRVLASFDSFTAGAGLGAILISTNAGHAASPPSYIDGASGYFATSTANVAAAWGVSL